MALPARPARPARPACAGGVALLAAAAVAVLLPGVAQALHRATVAPLAAARLTAPPVPGGATAPPPPPAAAAAPLAAPAVVPSPAAVPAPSAPNAALQPFDAYYGVYVSGQKVGWMRSQLVAAPEPTFTTQLVAKVSGMGQTSDIALDESRTYGGPDGALSKISFSQRAATGEVRVVGARQGGALHLEISAGGVTHAQDVVVQERLVDALATYRLARAAKGGQSYRGSHFDPSVQKVMQVEHTVLAVERRNLGGVDTQAVKLRSSYPEIGVDETAWLDQSGKVLESQIGGFFVARLEPAEVAKKLDYSQDLLVSAVVRAPRVLVAPQNIQKLTLQLTGFGEMVPPMSPRQQVRRQGERTVLILHKDAPPPRTPLGHPVKGADAAATASLQEALAPTPFIQSDAPALVAAARRATAGAHDAFAASSKLCDFVYGHVRSEYVPAFSNALEAFETARGDCTEHSVLFVALARARGIPARVAVGVAYWPPGDGFGWHAWAEVYIGGQWIAVDPTWNQPIADATHVKLADGDPAEQARIVMLLGQLKIAEMRAE